MRKQLEEIRFFHAEDFFWLLKREKRRLTLFACLGIFLACCFLLLLNPSYTIEASFKEQKEESGLESKDLLKQLFSGSLSSSSSHTVDLMKSRAILRPLVEKLGLQAEFISSGYLEDALRLARDLWIAEWKNPLPIPDVFRCKDIFYEGEKTLELEICFIDPERFEILDKKARLASGVLGEKVEIPHLLGICLTKAPESLKLQKPYRLRIHPWQKTLRSLTKKLKVIPRKASSCLYDLNYKTKDPVEGALILNTLMELLQGYLKNEHDHLAKEQLAYLAKRKEELSGELEKDLRDRALFMGKNLETQGFFTLSQEFSIFLEPHAKIMNELFMIEEELEQLEKEGALSVHSPLARTLERMGSEYDSLAQQKDLLKTSVAKMGEKFSDKAFLSSEFEGIDWESSRSLYRDYTHKLDREEAWISSLIDALEKVESKETQLGCFSNLLKDPTSEQLIASANGLYLQLKEQKYCSSKEQTRWQEDLDLQRKLFQEHIEQMLEVSQANAELIRQKLFVLQQASLECLQRQMSILEEHTKEEIENRKAELVQEKLRLKEKLQKFRSQFMALPDTWRSEELFAFKSETHQKIMEAIVQLVETKTIGHHLHHVGSKPLDEAIFPLLPNPPHLFLILFLGAFIGVSGCFFISLFYHSVRGFPMNEKKLKALGFSFSGVFSTKESLETLQNISLFMDSPSSGQVIGLLANNGPDFSEALATISAKTGRKVLLLDTHFSKESGLLHFLQQKISELPIQKKNSFHYVSSGDSLPLGAEWFLSPSFSSLIAELKKSYDWIFLSVRSPLESPLSRAALKICDKIVLSLRGEQIDLLTPFVSWAYDKDYCRLTFIAAPHERSKT